MLLTNLRFTLRQWSSRENEVYMQPVCWPAWQEGSRLMWPHMVSLPTQCSDYSVCSRLRLKWREVRLDVGHLTGDDSPNPVRNEDSIPTETWLLLSDKMRVIGDWLQPSTFFLHCIYWIYKKKKVKKKKDCLPCPFCSVRDDNLERSETAIWDKTVQYIQRCTVLQVHTYIYY